jgi:two-component system, cell cycle sensor histidine kinase and response regulator CckA
MQVLHLEDSPKDAELFGCILKEEWPGIGIQNVASRGEFESALEQGGFDLILSDYTMPSYDGLTALNLAHRRFPDTPFIFLSGSIGEDRAIDALNTGAADYVIKDRPNRLVSAIRQALAFAAEKKALRATEGRVREQAALLDKARDAIIAADLDHRITYWNASAERLYGWTAAEAAGRKLDELSLHSDPETFAAARKRIVEGGEWRGELRMRTKAGALMQVESTWSLVLDTGGRPQSILFIDTDVTEKRRLEAEILRTQRIQNIGMLAGGVAHDLNNALSPILMATELLRMECADPKQARLLDMIVGGAERGASMVKQILTFARGAEGKRGAVEINHLAKEMAGICRQTFPKKIQVHSETAPDIWTVIGDATQLHQVFLNLCVNARDAMPNGGELRLTAGNVHIDDAYARMSSPDAKPGPFVMVTVSDTGSGMSPEVRARIFDPFFTTKAADKGTGLGLSTVLNIVKGHGGFVTVQSAPKAGTVFKVYLPAKTGAPTAASAEEHPAPPPGAGELILVVDDEAAIRSIAANTLEMFGYQVLTAGDGAQAVVVCAQHREKLRLMITDMSMPVMDGPAAVQAVRSIAPDVKFIVTSGMDSDSRSKVATQGGAHAYMHKPYSADQLLQTVHDLLHKES